MGIDIGFDLFPCVNSDEDKIKWATLLELVRNKYKDDSLFYEDDNFLTINAGEVMFMCLYKTHPEHFRRFSSKISGPCGAAEEYVQTIRKLAISVFGYRVRYWSSYGYDNEPREFYDWGEVHEQRKIVVTKIKQNNEKLSQ